MYEEEDLEKVYHAIEAATSTCRTVCEDVALMPNLAIVKVSELHKYTAVEPLEIIRFEPPLAPFSQQIH